MDLTTGTVERRFEEKYGDSPERSLVLPDGRFVTFGGSTPVRIHADGGEQRLDHTAWAAAVSPNGMRLATGGEDRRVRVVEPATGKTVLVLRGHGRGIVSIAWLDDARVVSAENGFIVKVWDLDKKRAARAFGRKAETEHVLVASRWAAMQCAPTIVELWSVERGTPVYELDVGDAGGISSLAIHASGRVAAGTTRGVIVVFPAPTS